MILGKLFLNIIVRQNLLSSPPRTNDDGNGLVNIGQN